MTDQERLEKLYKIAKNVRANGARTTRITIYDLEYLLSTVEEQQKEIERLGKFIENLQVVHLVEIQGEKSENARLREALEFYADDTNHEYELTYDMARVNESKVMEDNGAIAKAALKE